jgi:hypothetical protein
MGPRNPQQAPELEEDENATTQIEDDEEDGAGGDTGEDAGSDDDESGDEAEAGHESAEEEAEEGQVAKPTRGEKRFQKLTREVRDAKEHAARVEQEIRALREQRQANDRTQNEQVTAEQERARLALMTADERVAYHLEKSERRHQDMMRQQQFAMADMADKAAYDAKATIDKRYERYKGRVEQLLQEERNNGRSFPRETILKFVLGEEVMKAQGTMTKTQRTEAQRRVNAQQARTTGGSSDRVASASGRRGAGNSTADLERRLEGQLL